MVKSSGSASFPEMRRFLVAEALNHTGYCNGCRYKRQAIRNALKQAENCPAADFHRLLTIAAIGSPALLVMAMGLKNP